MTTLPRDVARCNGFELGTGAQCPERADCARYLAHVADEPAGRAGTITFVGYSPKWAEESGCDQKIQACNTVVP
jgi:hypothetical protein